MNNDLISRSTLAKRFEDAQRNMSKSVLEVVFFDAVLGMVDNAPTVDAEPVRRGEWAHLGGDEWCCTSCGEVIHTEGSWEKPTRKYCHECGAKMDLEVQDD